MTVVTNNMGENKKPSFMMMRRGGGAADDIETFAMENCLNLVTSQARAAAQAAALADAAASGGGDVSGRMFTCKTCGRKFNSFQALGGHRASHKKLKPAVPDGGDDGAPAAPAEPKTHSCSICGIEFPTGQALGGHMRRHRPVGHKVVVSGGRFSGSTVTVEVSVENSDANSKKRKNDDVSTGELIWRPAVLSSKKVCLDLNLWSTAPSDEDEKLEVVKPEIDNDNGNDKNGGGGVKEEREVEEGEIVDGDAGVQAQVQVQGQEVHQENEDYDFLKLELRPPIRA